MESRDEKIAEVISKLVTVAFFCGLVLVPYHWSSLEDMTADATTKRARLWFYASDVAPGDVLDGHVEINDGMRVAIAGVAIRVAGDEPLVGGRADDWGDRIQTTLLGSDRGSDEIDFTVKIPLDARPGDVLNLDIEVQYESRSEHFRIDVPIHSRTTSALRRTGKAVMAFASWLAVVVFVVAVNRWHRRRDRSISFAWSVLLVPHAVLGWFWFSTLIEHATRLHGWWVVALCLFLWYFAFPFVYLILSRTAVCRYTVVQTRLPPAEGGVYRASGAVVPSIDVHVLEEAWRASGSVVERTRAELLVTHHRGRARVPIPAIEKFGGGETFEIRSDSEAAAFGLIESAASVLGELRWSVARRGKGVVSADAPAAPV